MSREAVQVYIPKADNGLISAAERAAEERRQSLSQFARDALAEKLKRLGLWPREEGAE